MKVSTKKVINLACVGGNDNLEEVKRVRTRVTIIGLAISMGASSLLLTRQERALAESPVDNEPGSTVLAATPTKQQLQMGETRRNTDELNALLKARQRFLISQLKQKPNRLKDSLTQLRYEGSNNLSAPATLSASSILEKRDVISPRSFSAAVEKTHNVNEPTVVVPPSASLYLQVRAGDTLTAIARHHGISLSALVNANQLADPDELQINQRLVIPPFQSSRTIGEEVASVDTKRKSFSVPPKPLAGTPRGALPYGVGGSIEEEIDELSPPTFNQSQLRKDSSPVPTTELQPMTTVPVNANAAESLQSIRGLRVFPQLPPLGTKDTYLPKPFDTSTPFKGYIWPAKGVLTSGYGRRWGRMHKGIDIAAPIGTPVLASAPGVVVKAGWTSGGFGKLVVLRHHNGALTRYAHNNRVLVQMGQPVEQGQVVAEMGSTGRSTGPHTHFELHQLGKGAVNPIAYLPR